MYDLNVHERSKENVVRNRFIKYMAEKAWHIIDKIISNGTCVVPRTLRYG
jgi:hypothetical protein